MLSIIVRRFLHESNECIPKIIYPRSTFHRPFHCFRWHVSLL